MARIALPLALLLGGCIDTTTEATTVGLEVAGTDASEPFDGRNGARVTLSRADLAFGPLYLCAGYTAGELCDEALAQWTDAAVVDSLDPSPVEVGRMEAITGTARSYMYDLGIASLLTRPEPLVTEAAASLGPASVVLEGTAEVDGQALPFTVAIRVEQSAEVEQGVPVIRGAESDGFEGEILPDDRSRLLVAFDPRPWLATADFGALVEDAACSPEREIACAGALEQRCAPDGTVAETRDCAAAGEACVREVGCVERIELAPDGQVGRAVRNAIAAGRRPSFQLEQAP